MSILVKALNLLLIILVFRLIYGIYLVSPSSQIIQGIDFYSSANDKLRRNNKVMLQKIKQAERGGPILQQKIRYYSGYFAPNEIFYKVNDW